MEVPATKRVVQRAQRLFSDVFVTDPRETANAVATTNRHSDPSPVQETQLWDDLGLVVVVLFFKVI